MELNTEPYVPYGWLFTVLKTEIIHQIASIMHILEPKHASSQACGTHRNSFIHVEHAAHVHQ